MDTSPSHVATYDVHWSYTEMEIGNRIEEARRKAGMSQSRLAIAVGTQQNSVSRWEKGSYAPSLSQAARIAQVCEVDLAWLITGQKKEVENLSPDERQILDLYRALGLRKDEALRRLASAAGGNFGPSPERAEDDEPYRRTGTK